jgi:hypothetical protein
MICEQARAFWVAAPGRGEIRDEPLREPSADEVAVRALFSGISRGTESLVFQGRVPVSERERMAAPFQAGTFPAPVKYGYASVGTVERGPAALAGRQAFVLFPHQTCYVVPAAAVYPLPDRVPPARAVLAANMETALNAVWDGAPGPVDRIAVVGGGLLGLLVAYLCARLPGAQVTVVDIAAARAPLAQALGAGFAAPEAAPTDCDLVFHASASPAGLANALRLAGEEATIVELSWYGSGDVAAPLGEAFHSRRLRLVSSQVGKVAPSHRSRWTHRQRLAAALALLADPALDALIAPAISFADLPKRLPAVFAADSNVICQLIQYPTQ